MVCFVHQINVGLILLDLGDFWTLDVIVLASTEGISAEGGLALQKVVVIRRFGIKGMGGSSQRCARLHSSLDCGSVVEPAVGALAHQFPSDTTMCMTSEEKIVSWQ
eukprot:10332686-Karenia_brevis.AAC.1